MKDLKRKDLKKKDLKNLKDLKKEGDGMKDLKRKDLKKPKRSEKQTVKSRECICQIKEDLAPKEHPKKNKTETL